MATLELFWTKLRDHGSTPSRLNRVEFPKFQKFRPFRRKRTVFRLFPASSVTIIAMKNMKNRKLLKRSFYAFFKFQKTGIYVVELAVLNQCAKFQLDAIIFDPQKGCFCFLHSAQ